MNKLIEMYHKALTKLTKKIGYQNSKSDCSPSAKKKEYITPIKEDKNGRE